MTTAPLRKDAARNWQRIVDVARQYLDEGKPLQLNDVARTASVGVATVYRHFPTPEALVETIAAPRIEDLIRHAERGLATADPWTALREFLNIAIEVQLTDPAVPPVFAAPAEALPRTTELKQRIVERFEQLLRRAHAAGMADPEVAKTDLMPLMCGITYAANVHPAADARERVATGRRYLAVLLEGLRVRG